MGKYCDLCKEQSEDAEIDTFVCFSRAWGWIDIEFNICKNCSTKVCEILKECVGKEKYAKFQKGDIK